MNTPQDTETSQPIPNPDALPRHQAAKIRGIVFDKDGTLFSYDRTWGPWTGAFIEHITDGNQDLANELARRLEFDRETGTFLPTSPAIAETMDFLIDTVMGTVPGLDRGELWDFVIESTSHAPQAPTVPLPALLEQLTQAGYAMGVATNDAIEPANVHLRNAGIHDHFGFIAGYDSGYGSKPGPGMLTAFCQQTDMAPEECLMIGDSLHDLSAGRAAGMITMGVLTGPASADELTPLADVVAPDIGHLPRILGL